MKVMKKTSLMVCVIIMGAMTQNAFALPYSTFGDKKWQGYKNYNDAETGVKMTLYFNVYDTVTNPTEFTWSGGKPNDDRYIYAYQIINKSDSVDISLFSLLKDSQELTSQIAHDTRSQSDGSLLSIVSNPVVSTDPGIWEWSAEGGLSAGKNSWYLIFSSDYAPTKGSFRVEAASPTEPPVPEVPEPATLALFGIASALYAAKRGRKRQAG